MTENENSELEKPSYVRIREILDEEKARLEKANEPANSAQLVFESKADEKVHVYVSRRKINRPSLNAPPTIWLDTGAGRGGRVIIGQAGGGTYVKALVRRRGVTEKAAFKASAVAIHILENVHYYRQYIAKFFQQSLGNCATDGGTPVLKLQISLSGVELSFLREILGKNRNKFMRGEYGKSVREERSV